MRFSIVAIVMLAGCILAVQPVLAQQYAPPGVQTPYSPPAVSPYLLLLQQNQNGVSNYQTLVRPMLDQQQQQFRASLPQNQPYQPSQGGNFQAKNPATTGIATNVRSTGHESTYMNYSHYYRRTR